MMVLEKEGANINHVSLSFVVMHKTLKSVDLCTQGGSKYECFIAHSLQSWRKVSVFLPSLNCFKSTQLFPTQPHASSSALAVVLMDLTDTFLQILPLRVLF